MFSAFTLDQVHGWVAIHRLPLDDAIHYIKQFRKQDPGCLAALVPDGIDPSPYLDLAENARVRNAISNATQTTNYLFGDPNERLSRESQT